MPKIEKKGIAKGNIETDSVKFDIFGGQHLDSTLQSPDENTLAETARLTTKYVSLDRINDNTDNPFNVKNTYFLKESIKKIGQLQPIILIHQLNADEKPTGNYEIKAGSRRYKAFCEIVAEAKKDNDEATLKKFQDIWVSILPMGATAEEIQQVITETNTTARHITVEEIFKNFEVVFKTNAQGEYIYFAKKENKINAATKLLKDMGFNYSPATVKIYFAIYTSHNKEIRKDYEKGFLSLKQALTVARMPPAMQDSVMEKFKNMTDKEIADYIKTYNLEKKVDKKNLKGIDVLNSISKTTKTIYHLTDKKIHLNDDIQKNQILESIDEALEYLQKLKKQIEK